MIKVFDIRCDQFTPTNSPVLLLRHVPFNSSLHVISQWQPCRILYCDKNEETFNSIVHQPKYSILQCGNPSISSTSTLPIYMFCAINSIGGKAINTMCYYSCCSSYQLYCCREQDAPSFFSQYELLWQHWQYVLNKTNLSFKLLHM